MRTHDENSRNHTRRDRRNLLRYALIALLLVVACIGGIKTGNWISDRRVEAGKQREADEYLGLGERTGLTGDLALQVNPTNISAYPGQPISIDLTLVNRGKKNLVLNSWPTPAPAFFGNNQFPFKIEVTKDGRRIPFRGNAVLLPLHSAKDFFVLHPGERRVVKIDPARLDRIGKWDLSVPGVYAVEMWYETYLTGRYIGVRAWTGMTNHVVVNLTILPRRRG